jgi:hypothetical protein
MFHQEMGTGSNVLTGNTGIGAYAGFYNETGTENTYVGYSAGFGADGQNNNENTGIGRNALFAITDGGANTAVGKYAGAAVTGGDNNTIMGRNAGSSINSGGNNTIIGTLAGDGIQGGSGNIMIGYNVDVDDDDAIDRMALGNSFTVNTDNRCHIGDGGYRAELYFGSSGESWGSTSDERIKKNIVDTDLGLDFVNKLRPIKYQDKPTSEHPESFNIQEPKDTASDKVLDGLLAQEVKSAVDDLGTTFSGWTVNEKTTKQRLQYEKFVLPLIKAVQELSTENEALEARVKALEDA